MEDGRNGALRITSKNTDGSKVITMRHSCQTQLKSACKALNSP